MYEESSLLGRFQQVGAVASSNQFLKLDKMPAVSVCDPLAVAIRHNLDTAGQSKSSDDLNISLTGSGPRILRTELDYEEADNYRSNVQDRLKSKYMVLSLPKQEDNGKVKDIATCSKNSDKSKEPRLPEPAVTLYAPDKVNLGWNKMFPMPVGSGMYNVGNTCYLNSTLQALFHVPALVNWLLSDAHHESKCEQNGKQFIKYIFLVYQAWYYFVATFILYFLISI